MIQYRIKEEILRQAAEMAYGSFRIEAGKKGGILSGCLAGHKVFCPDLAPAELALEVVGEGGEPVFIDADEGDWGMDPVALEKAFSIYPDTKIVLFSHLYGFPGQIDRVRTLCDRFGAVLIEDASDSLGARIEGRQAGSYGDYGIYGDAREAWTQDLTEAKRAIYEYYEERLNPDVIYMNPIGKGVEPSYQTSCITCESGISFLEERPAESASELSRMGLDGADLKGAGLNVTGPEPMSARYESMHGTAGPMEIYAALQNAGIESRPIYRPMSLCTDMQEFDLVTVDGVKRKEAGGENESKACEIADGSVSASIYATGLCLPSSVDMTREEQDRVIEIVNGCFD